MRLWDTAALSLAATPACFLFLTSWRSLVPLWWADVQSVPNRAERRTLVQGSGTSQPSGLPSAWPWGCQAAGARALLGALLGC